MPSRTSLRVAVLPAAPLRNVFEMASNRIEARLQRHLLVAPDCDSPDGIACQQSQQLGFLLLGDLQKQPVLQLQQLLEPDSNQILRSCSKPGLKALQNHFQPTLIGLESQQDQQLSSSWVIADWSASQTDSHLFGIPGLALQQQLPLPMLQRLVAPGECEVRIERLLILKRA